MRIKEVLEKKGHNILTVAPNTTVYDAISKMAEFDIGALLVTENDKLCGIISERDYRNKVILKGRTSKETPVKDIMTDKVICISPMHQVDNCLAIMSKNKIRHLPVMDEDKLVGIISIGDLVKSIIDEQKDEIEDLKSYISGGYPA